jgi:hypothetical protein
MNLSDHFTLEELAQSDTAVRLGIDNTPSEAVIAHLKVLALGLERIRAVLGRPITIKSGYRCEALEKLLCAKDFAAWCTRHGKAQASAWPEYFAGKAHPHGYAADFICPGFGTPVEIVRAAKAAGFKFDQLIEEGTWVHASFDPRLRGEVLTARFDSHGTPTYTQVS